MSAFAHHGEAAARRRHARQGDRERDRVEGVAVAHLEPAAAVVEQVRDEHQHERDPQGDGPRVAEGRPQRVAGAPGWSAGPTSPGRRAGRTGTRPGARAGGPGRGPGSSTGGPGRRGPSPAAPRGRPAARRGSSPIRAGSRSGPSCTRGRRGRRARSPARRPRSGGRSPRRLRPPALRERRPGPQRERGEHRRPGQEGGARQEAHDERAAAAEELHEAGEGQDRGDQVPRVPHAAPRGREPDGGAEAPEHGEPQPVLDGARRRSGRASTSRRPGRRPPARR